MNLMRGIDLRKVSIDMLLLLLLQAVLHMSRNKAVSHLAMQLDQPRHVLQAVFTPQCRWQTRCQAHLGLR